MFTKLHWLIYNFFKNSLKFLLLWASITFSHQECHNYDAYGGSYLIVAARNAWEGNLVCLCVMENKICIELWMVKGVVALKRGLRN
jgi:hypothetical protein